MTGLPAALGDAGFAVLPPDARTLAWAQAASLATDGVLADPAMRARWLVCEGTWFVGVDALPNTAEGAVGDVALAGPVVDMLRPLPPLHRAQVSVTYPGYPRPREGETGTAFRYRQTRDAAHVDGILAEGDGRRRYIREPHAFVLGLPLNTADPGASPLVVWRGSHRVLGGAFRDALAGVPPQAMADVDVTEVYTRTRRQVFDTCERVEIHAAPGGAILLHPHLLHGVAPWQAGAQAPGGRRIAYFRPLLPRVADWLAL